MLAETNTPVAPPVLWLAAGTDSGAGRSCRCGMHDRRHIGGFSGDLLVAAYLGLSCRSVVHRIGVTTV